MTDYAEQDEHDQWHPHWVEGCDGCIDRADHLERTRALPDPHVMLEPVLIDPDPRARWVPGIGRVIEPPITGAP
jgi:hypothetical protein